MIAAGSGLAVDGAADNAALEASLEALGRSGTDRADLALVFVTGDALPRAHAALHAVRRVTGARAVLGCSGSGILTDRLDPAGGKRDAGVEQRFRKPQVVGSSPTSGSSLG